MELPKFRSQAGVSMASANVSAARMSTPSPIKANTRTFRPTQTAAQAAAMVSNQTSGLETALGIGSKLLDYAIEVDQNKQDMALKTANAEHKNHMAYWFADYESKKFELNEETGRPNWETFEKDYQTASDQAQGMLREKYKFSGKGRESAWKLNTDTTDTNNQVHIIGSVAKAKHTEGVAEYKIAKQNAHTIKDLQDINATAMKAGYVTEAQATESERLFMVSDRFKMTARASENMSLADAAAMREEMQNPTAPQTKQYTDTQRNTLADMADQRIQDYHSTAMLNAFRQKGPAGAAAYIENLAMGGPELSGADGADNHMDMVRGLSTDFSGMKSATEEQKVTVAYSTGVDSYLNGTGGNDADVAHLLDDSKFVKQLDATLGEQFNNFRQANPGKSPLATPDGIQVLSRSGDLHHVSKPVKTELNHMFTQTSGADETQLRDMTTVIRGMQEIQKSNPTVWEDNLSAPAKERYDFYESALQTGKLDPRSPESLQTLNGEYEAISNMDETVRTRRKADAKNALNPDKKSDAWGGKGVSVEKRYNRQADAFEDEIDEIDFDARAIYRDNFNHYYELTGDADRAEYMAYKATRRRVGHSLITGEVTTEVDAPSVVMNMPATEVQEQHIKAMKALSEQMPDTPIEPEAVRRVLIGKKRAAWDPTGQTMTPTWQLINVNGTALLDAQGKKQYFQPKRGTNEKAAIERRDVQAPKFRVLESSIVGAINKASYELPENGSDLEREYERIPGGKTKRISGKTGDTFASGWPRTPDSFAERNRHEWSTMPDEARVAANDMYHEVYGQLMDLALSQRRTDGTRATEEDADYRVRLFLDSRGYKSMDETGEYVPPPGLH